VNYQKFDDLPVWNTAIELAVRVFALTETGCLAGYSGFRDQIERATVSIAKTSPRVSSGVRMKSC